MQRRIFMTSVAAAAASASGLVQAQSGGTEGSYPEKPIRIIVPFAAGISPDVVARIVGDKLSQAWKQPVIVDNKPGAAGIIGAQAAAASPADGYTLFLAVTSVMAINPHVYTKPKYGLDDFKPVAELLTVPYVLTASPNAPFSTLKQLVEYARQNPGKLDYASLGVGSQPHVVMEVWQKKLGIKLQHIPYKSSPAADLIAGMVSLYLDPSTTAIPLIRGNKVKAIAASGPTRISSLPEVPTASEYLAGLESTAWQGVFVPKGTPDGIVNKLSAQFERIVQLPDVHAKLVDYGLEPTGRNAATFASRVDSDYALWGSVVRSFDIKVGS